MPHSRYYLFFLSIFFSAITYSQKKIEIYYDYQWKKCQPVDARFYSIALNTDTGWYEVNYYINLKKLQRVGLFEDKECLIRNGTFYWFYPDGTLKSTGTYVHNKKNGVWMNYFPDKSVKDSLNYIDGNLTGVSLGWYNNGSSRDSSNLDTKGNGVYVSWFDNGNPSSAGKYIEFDKQQGKWQYFHKNGKLSSLETYDHNILLDKNYFDDKGNPMSDTSGVDLPTQFNGGDKAWGKYMSRNLHFPNAYEIENNSQAMVVVIATVNEEGKVIDVELSVPLFSVFDKIALDAVKNSPAWQPAESHNRKVYGSFTQTVCFSQGYYL
jgi:hypothetical protein